jgi:aspartate/methionine/tyrosine aminotransferase
MSDLEQLREPIVASSPALWAALSPLGRRLAFPPDIPFQAGQARGKRFNGTIGQVTDGAGRPLALPAIERALALADAARDRALLYSPVQGLPEVRAGWRHWQRRSVSGDPPSTLPLVTVGLTHGLSLAADLFAGEGRAVAVPAPFWGNYRQTFAARTGARIVTAPAYRDGVFDPLSVTAALAAEPAGEPAIAIVNLPSNPGGYMPDAVERAALCAALEAEAEKRPLVVVCDDAYAGLVYEDVPAGSLFWDLIGRHPQLLPLKIDGGTKEFSLFGGRVGFVTFPFAPDSEIAAALESKVKCLVRAVVGSPVATSQVLLQQALEASDVEAQVEAVRQRLARRYRELRRVLAAAAGDLLRPLPFNAGCFALVELASGLDPEVVRRHLLEHHDTGLIAVQPRYLRIAFCSVRCADLEELVRRLERGVDEVSTRRGPSAPA